ncbi:MAG: MFS transporter, partial [Rhodospirillaceae bacterium]
MRPPPSAPAPPPPRWHYGWAVAAACMLTVLVSLGFGRFALGMLLPAMGAALPLSYAEMGFVSTGNFIGYTLGVMAAGQVVARVGERRAIVAGMFVCAASMLGVGLAGGFGPVVTIYALTGFAGGVANVTAMGLISHWFTRRLRGRAAGFQVTGSSFAIVFGGLTIPQINLMFGAEGWRTGWLVLGGLSLAIAVVCALVLRNRPEDVGLNPAGGDADAAAAARVRGHPGRGVVWHLGVIYFFFGMTYAVYLTFAVTSLVDERGLSEVAAGRFWAMLGLVTLVSGPLFGFLSDRFGRRAG